MGPPGDGARDLLGARCCANRDHQVKPRLVLHIGCHKTGTTSIQRALTAQTSALLAQGVLYPLWGEDVGPSKHGSLLALRHQRDQPAGAQWVDRLTQRIARSGAHTVILSEERLWVAQTLQPLFTTLRPLFSHIDVVAMLRRQDLYLESMYAENLKSASRLVRVGMLEFAHSDKGRQRMDFAAVLDAWAALADSVRVVDFSVAAKAGRLFSSFCELAQLPADLLAPSDTVANVTPDIELMLVLQQLRLRGHNTPMQTLLNVAATLTLPARPPGTERWLSLADRQAVLQSYAASNARLAERWRVQFDDHMPASPAQTRDQPDANYVIDLLDAVTKQLRLAHGNAARRDRDPAPAAKAP